MRAHGALYFGASVDDPEKNRAFAESLGLDYPVLSDPGKEVAKAYGVLAALGLATHRWTFYIGPDGRVREIDQNVQVKTAGADIARKLDALGLSQTA